MVDVIQIPNLPAATSLDGAEMFEVVQGGVSSRATVTQIADHLGAVTSVNGRTGAVVVTKTDVGLGNADNTSDANKPISTATQTALNLKTNIADLASDVDQAKGAGLVGFLPSGTGADGRTVGAKLRDVLSVRDYDTAANARTAAVGGVLVAAPTTNSGFAGAKTREGLISGHINIGDTSSSQIDAHVGLLNDETYANTGQEVRGSTFTMRNYRTTPDEATLGWDFFGVVGAAVVESANTQYIRGSMKGVVGEVYAFTPLSGTYKVKTSYPLQSVTVIGDTNVTLESWYGVAVNAPTGTDFSTPAPAGSVETAYGVRIDDIAQGSVERAAIKIVGTGTNGQIKWGTFRIVPSSTGNEGDFYGRTRFGGASGAETMMIEPVASAVNRIEVYGAATGNRPIFRFTGSDANVGAQFQTKGSAGYLFYTDFTNLQFEVESGGAITTWVQVRGGTASTNPRVNASGNNLALGTGAALATNATTGFVTLPTMAGTPTGAPVGAGAGECPTVVDTSASKLWAYIGGTWKSSLLGPQVGGQCYLQITGANLELIPMGGSVININGALYTLPASTTLSASGAAALTAYYIYAYMVSTTVTLERSTTGYTVNSSGVPQKTGDATRTLVGQGYTNGASAWSFALSYWNRRRRVVTGTVLAANRTVTVTTAATVNSFEAIIGFLAWADEAVHVQLNGSWTVSGAAQGFAQIVYDGATGGIVTQTSSTSTTNVAINEDRVFTAGAWHTADLWGYRTGGTSVVFVGVAASGGCGLQAVVCG